MLTVATTGLVGPLLGAKPVLIMLLSQAISPLIMPMLTLGLLLLSRRQELFGPAHWSWTGLLALIFIFSLIMAVISYQGIFQ